MFNYLSLEMPTSAYQLQRAYKATYRRTNYEHEYARVYVRDWGVMFRQVKPGTPIKMTLDKKDFHGYIHDLKTHQDSGKNFTEIGIIGASYVMRQASQKVYRNVTADQVVSQIAMKYGFAYHVEPHPRVYPQIAQAGLTDWELMVKLAKQCGYFFRAEGTTLHFKPLMKDFVDLSLEAPTFYKADSGFKPINTLYSFRALAGETLHSNGVDKGAVSVAGVDAESGQYFKYTSPTRALSSRAINQQELFDKHATHVVANSYVTATHEAESAENNTRFPYTAEVEVTGTSRINPGHPIYLEGIGPEYSGYWTVLEVHHEVVEENLNMQRFTTKLLVGTDGLGPVSYPGILEKPPAKAIRKIDGNSLIKRIIPKTVLRVPGVPVLPASSVALVTKANRGPGTPEHSTAAYTWRSTHGNVNQIVEREYTPPAVRARLMDYATRSF